jgi:DNA invertase Pin-like site-specific DNA recombinase
VQSAIPCILYAAKSSEDVRGSLITQIQDCQQAVAEAGDRTIVAEHADEAASGFSRNRGPALAAAMTEAERLASEHGTAELWVQHSDRLARGDGRTARHLVEVALWALKSSVVVHCVEDVDTFRDLLYAVVTGQRNHEDSRRKGAASAAGIKRATLRGEYVGQPLDGYRVVVVGDERGRVTKHLEIDPSREALFRMFFRMAKRGKMPSEIARRANREGWATAPRRRDNHPGPITPRFVEFALRNARYAGLAAYKGRGRRPRPVASLHLPQRAQEPQCAGASAEAPGASPPTFPVGSPGQLRLVRRLPDHAHRQTSKGRHTSPHLPVYWAT